MILFTVKMIRGIIFAVGLSIIINLINPKEVMADKALMRLYFVVPFSIETYLPITMENIEDQGYAIWFMEKHQFISELLNILKSHPTNTNKQIHPKGIRLKVDFGELEGVFFVDRNGVILQKDTNATFSLSENELEYLQKQLQYFIGVVDIKAFKRMTK